MLRAARAARRLAVGVLLVPVLAACGRQRPALSPHATASAVDRLRHELDAVLAAPALASGVWGIVVRSLARDDTLYSVNARTLLVPASSLKLATLAVAAERLGWDHSFETRLVASGTVDNGILVGDLVVIGSGDPSLMDADGSAPRVFADWVDRLVALGVRQVTGRVIGDDNAFDDEALGAGWMWDDLASAYSAGIGALQLNLNTARVRVAPGLRPGDPASIVLTSGSGGLALRNVVVTGEAGSTPTVVTRRQIGSSIVELAGSVALGAVAIERVVAVDNPTLNFVSELRKALVAGGIAVGGDAVDVDALAQPVDRSAGITVGTHRSPPLDELALTLMKTSQNQYAETLLKALGDAGGTATFERGRQVIREVLGQWGVPTRELVLADGSGLSRYNLITPTALVAILTHVFHEDRLRQPFVASLPVAGTDGTLSGRLKNTPAAGNLRAKTGSMTHARSLSGYVNTADGEPLVLAIVVNNFGVPATVVDDATDTIVARLASFSRTR